MQETKSESTYGFLGRFPSKSKEGDIQSMLLQEGNEGRFWMSLKSVKVESLTQEQEKSKSENWQSKSLVRNFCSKDTLAEGEKKHYNKQHILPLKNMKTF